MRVNIRNQIIELIEDMKYNLLHLDVTLIEECNTCVATGREILACIREEAEYGFTKSVAKDYYRILDECMKELEKLREQGVIESLAAKLDILMNKLKEEEEVKLEVVFLPYNARMWDSLESVYLAALEHPRCNAYVIPIPFYDKNQDGSLGQMHYEGDDFPQDQVMLDYKTYDIKSHCPDVVFVHNPYDNRNKVTSIEPMYYSSELKKCTGCLVYIPYYVERNYRVNDLLRGLHPVIRNADIIVCQNDMVAKLYAELGKRDKVLVAGSPKVDRLFNSKCDINNLPHGWSGKIRGRKTVLLNTHILTFVENSKNAIEGLMEMFAWFKHNNDMVLWWRPHPLTIETMKAMNPDVRDAYLECVSCAQNMENCIYDDDADMTNALLCTDAYIGNYSSLVSLYAATGKAIKTVAEGQKVFTSVKDSKFPLSILEFYLEGDMLWFVPRNFNALFRMNMQDYSIEYAGTFNKDARNKKEMFCKLVRYGNELWFVPKTADNIYYMNMDTWCIEAIELPESIRYQKYKTFTYCSKNEYIWLLPNVSSIGLRVNMRTKEIDIRDNMIPDGKITSTYTGCDMYGDTIIAAEAYSNVIMLYNTVTNNSEYIKLEASIEKEPRVFILDNNIYITDSKKVYIYDMNMKLVREKELLIDGQHFWIMNFFRKENELWLSSYCGCILKWNVVTDELKYYYLNDNKNPVYFSELPKWGAGAFFEYNSKIYCTPCDFGYLVEIDSDSNVVNEIAITMDESWIYSYIAADETGTETSHFIWDDAICSTQMFLSLLKHNKIDKSKKQIDCAKRLLGSIDGDVGKNIINSVCELFI